MNWHDKILYDYAMSFIGRPYRWGGESPMEGYDCSGFVLELLESVGLLPKRDYDTTAQGLFDFLESGGRAVHTPGCSFGAIVFYGSSVTRINHVAFGLDHYRVIEAGGGDSRTDDAESAIKDQAFVRIRPLDWRSDRVSILKPFYKTMRSRI